MARVTVKGHTKDRFEVLCKKLNVRNGGDHYKRTSEGNPVEASGIKLTRHPGVTQSWTAEFDHANPAEFKRWLWAYCRNLQVQVG